MKNNFQLALLLTLAVLMFAATLYIFRPVDNKLTRVTVAGEADARVSPDTAVITFAVVTQNSQAVTAQQENARKSEAVMNAVNGVAAENKREVKTDDYSLQPEQDYSSKMPRIIGYTARNSVTVSIADLKAVGTIIDAATKAGANSVEGVKFVVRGDSPSRGAALALASKQAMAKAKAVAQSLNGRIVRVIESHENGVQPYPPAPESSGYGSMMSNSSMAPAKRSYNTPVAAGSLDVNSQVVLTVEIEIKR